MMVNNCQTQVAQQPQQATHNNTTTSNQANCGTGNLSLGGMMGSGNMMLMMLQLIMTLLQQMQSQSQGNQDGNANTNTGNTNTGNTNTGNTNTGNTNTGNTNTGNTNTGNTNTGNTNTGNTNTGNTNTGNTNTGNTNTGNTNTGNTNTGGTGTAVQPEVVVCELPTEPEPVICEADQKVMDYVEGRQGTWLTGHGDYNGKSTGQDVYTFKDGEMKGYTAHHVEGGKYDIKNADGDTLCQHDSGKDRNKVASPVAFDLNGDNKIGTTGETTAKERAAGTEMGQSVQFDIDGDGELDNIEWMNGDGDGLLVDTSKIGADGAIDGNALFGDQGGQFENGYDKMAQLDANGDGKLAGDELNNLGIWIDDGDAKLEEGELRTLGEFDIKEMSTQKQDVQNDRGETLMQSDAKTSTGETVMTEDVWFGKE